MRLQFLFTIFKQNKLVVKYRQRFDSVVYARLACIHATTLVSLNNSSAQSLNTLNLTWIRSKSKCRTYLVLVSLGSCFQSFAYRFLSRMLFASSTLMMFTANVCGILFVFAHHTYTATVCCCRSFSSVYNISTTYTVSNDRHIFE